MALTLSVWLARLLIPVVCLCAVVVVAMSYGLRACLWSACVADDVRVDALETSGVWRLVCLMRVWPPLMRA